MWGLVFLIVCAICAHAQEDGGEVMVTGDKNECINQMIQWCNKMQYPQEGAGLAVMSISYYDQSRYYRVFCTSDSDGTNCTRNREAWFTCSPDHTLTYKGKILTMDSKDVDDDICNTTDKALNELFIQNLSYDNETLKREVEKGMESFFRQMSAMEEQIEMMHRMLRRIPTLDNFWGDFEDGFPIHGPSDSTTDMPSDKRNNSNDRFNQIERE